MSWPNEQGEDGVAVEGERNSQRFSWEYVSIDLAQTVILGLRITQEFHVLLPPGKCSGARAMDGIDLIWSLPNDNIYGLSYYIT